MRKTDKQTGKGRAFPLPVFFIDRPQDFGDDGATAKEE